MNRLLPAVHAAGIPCLTLHDAVLVPESTALTVQNICAALAADHFGFVPRFRVSYSPHSRSFSSAETVPAIETIGESLIPSAGVTQ